MPFELGELEWPSEMELFINGQRVGSGSIEDLRVMAAVMARPGDRVSFREPGWVEL